MNAYSVLSVFKTHAIIIDGIYLHITEKRLTFCGSMISFFLLNYVSGMLNIIVVITFFIGWHCLSLHFWHTSTK